MDERKTFSQRHGEAIYQRKIGWGFSSALYESLWRAVKKSCSRHSYYEYWEEVEDAAEYLKGRLGKSYFVEVPKDSETDKKVIDTGEGIFQHGYPSQVLEIIEVISWNLPSEKKSRLETDVNQAFRDHKAPWILDNGTCFYIDSEFFAREVYAQAGDLLLEAGFEGALHEFQKARDFIAQKNYGDAIVQSHNALESTIKGIFDERSKSWDKLTDKLIKSGLLPSHWKGFCEGFEKILDSIMIERSQPGRGHGSGKSKVEIPESIAMLHLNLCASLIVYLLHLNLEKGRADGKPEPPDDDLPF